MRSTAWASIRRATHRCDQSAFRAVVTERRSFACSVLATESFHHVKTSHASDSPRRIEKIVREEALSQPQDEQQAHKLFFDFLQGNLTAYPLPKSVSRVDAYLHLRRFDPKSLANLTDEALDSLCKHIGLERIGGVINNILHDLDGNTTQDDDFIEDPDAIQELSRRLQEGSEAQKGGIFAAIPGSKRRMTAVQNLIIGASRRRNTSSDDDLFPSEEIDQISSMEHIMSDSTLSGSLNMLLSDFRLLQQRQGLGATQISPIPHSLDVGTARRLCRAIYRSKDGSLAPILLADRHEHTQRKCEHRAFVLDKRRDTRDTASCQLRFRSNV
jgi:hypothetical protein